MANYQYIARTAGGDEVVGVMQADNESAVVRTLDERKLFPVRVTAQEVRRGGGLAGRVGMRHLAAMYGQMADLLQSGVPLLRALEILGRAGLVRTLAEMVMKVREDVSEGKPLADALAGHPKVINPLHPAMIRAGERGGFLEEVLRNLSEFLERQDELRSKVRGAMIYPVILMVLGLAAMIVALLVLVPQFQPLFAGMPLPLPTQMLFSLSSLLREQWPLVVTMCVLAATAGTAFFRSALGRRAWDRWRLRMPLFGRAVRMVSITRFCRILGTMLANGVPIIQALAISKDATGSVVLGDSVESAVENVRRGDPLAAPLRASGLFPAEVVEMIAVAEESNQLEKVLVQIADTVERRTNRQVDQAVRLMEPLILVVMAAGIGFVAVGLLYPIFTMARTLR